MMKKEGFPKSLRIKKKKEWEEVIQKGERAFSQNLVIFNLKTDEEKTKFGVGVNSGIKSAVKRNRIKRVLREVIRKNRGIFFPGNKVILIHRSKKVDINYNEILKEFLKLAEKLRKIDA